MPAAPASPSTGHHCRHRDRGLTLVELMVGVSILAVVLAIAAPSYRQFGRSTRVVTQASELQGALSYARSESLRRGVRVTICRSADPLASSPACSSSGTWASGWLVFVDNVQVGGNAAGVVDGNDSVLRVGEPATGSTVTTTGNLGTWLTYSAQGLVRTDGGPANGAFTVCQAPTGRRISVSPVGLVSNVEEVCS
ncbi:MAG: GspH/FimT family pseudopilin [Burkholderiaceae bacterium]|nr:GspH/FimT family pseudopilin [Burkholderiaceae bacterium]